MVNLKKASKLLIALFIILFLQYIYSSEYDKKYNQLSYSPSYDISKYISPIESKSSEFKCNNETISCSGNGICINSTDCQCHPGYATIPGSYVKCNYQMKSKTTALLLESFVGFGLGHFYISQYMRGVLKFLFYFFSCYFIFCIMIFVGSINNSNVDQESYDYTKRTTIILIPLMIGWYIFDVIMFLSGNYKDNNSMDLY